MKKGTEDAVTSSAQGVALSNKGPKTTHVNNADLWTLEDDVIFLKYWEDPGIACYHAMSRETSARPG